jgi:hypothetical protein
MRTLLFGAVMCAILLVAATTRSDVASSADVPVDETAPLPEPTTGAVDPTPTTDPPPKDPFAPFDIGPPESIWPYELLTPEEQAVVDRGRDTTAWKQTHDAYAAGVSLLSQRARAEAAQHLLGVDTGVQNTGVVP